jgi:wobble nucleotide-excising tRNase
MINRILLLRNIGKFDSVDAAAAISLKRVTLIYAENGRGKTTLSAVLRSLATGDPIPIAERRRLAAQHAPHVVLDCVGGPAAVIFQNNGWNRTLPNMAVFDDFFVDANVHSGLAVGSDHRQNLHELVLGAQGVALNERVQELIARIETHNATLRVSAAAIPFVERAPLAVDEFCALPARADIDTEIQDAERSLAAAREQDPVRNTPVFDRLSLPPLDIAASEAILQRDLPELEADALALVQAHLQAQGNGAEAWVADGMRRLTERPPEPWTGMCPFCAQDLEGSPVIRHYQAYFSDAYRGLKNEVSDTLAAINRTHGGDALASFERALRVAGERRQFWSRFCNVPDLKVDSANIGRDWRAAADGIEQALTAKQATPLERMNLTEATRRAVAAFETHSERMAILNQQLLQENELIRIVKERAVAGNAVALATDLVRLKAVKARHTPRMMALCDAYLNEKAAKAATEQIRDQAKAALEQYRENVFPGYQTAINVYLERFNAGFRLSQVTSANTRGGPTCTYNVVINNTAVPVAGGAPVPGQPSFRSTLSAGDRTTLALAFFLSSLDQDPGLVSKVVAIDDPVSSLDEHRSLTTVQEIRRLAQRAAQVIVLSHSKHFLCRIWEGTDTTLRVALQVTRDGSGSTIGNWDVQRDSITEHDKRHALFRQYMNGGVADNREVAREIRPMLEAFLRVACPEYFPPGTLLGPFRGLCTQRIGTPQAILNAQATQELSDLIEYANRFHHDTNPAYEMEAINDGELRGFVNRAMMFARP